MRLSCVEGDPGYPQWRRLRGAGLHAEVWLDGVRVSKAITADEQTGEVIRYADGDRNGFKLTEDGEDVVRETLHGKVQIRFPFDPPANRGDPPTHP